MFRRGINLDDQYSIKEKLANTGSTKIIEEIAAYEETVRRALHVK